VKRIERLQANRVVVPSSRRRTLGFEFLKPARSGRTVVEARDLVIRAGDKPLLADASFALERGEHVGLIGPNGSGKTTLLETLLGRRPPVSGTVRLGHGVEAAYFSQHEVELDERGSVLQATQGATGLQRPDAQNLLGRFLFSGWDEHEKPVAALSGGERRRLALALVVASGANFLVLDEPTNHLDLESREALEAALDAFPGTVLLVSHDRALLDGIAERTLAIEHGTLNSYDGGWAEYTRRREQVDAPAPSPDPEPRKAKAAPRQAAAEASNRARAHRDPDRRGRGAGRRPRAPARGRLERHGEAVRAPQGPRRASGPPGALGTALRALAGVAGRNSVPGLSGSLLLTA